VQKRVRAPEIEVALVSGMRCYRHLAYLFDRHRPIAKQPFVLRRDFASFVLELPRRVNKDRAELAIL
jgi:hypothetical protein